MPHHLLLSFLDIFVDAMFLINQINKLPPEVVGYFTHPGTTEAPDRELLLPFVESALPLAYVVAYGVLGVLLFHVSIHRWCSFIFLHLFT